MAWLKRLAAPKWWPIERKTHKFISVPRGSHPNKKSIPLIVIIRDVLKVADDAKEAKKIIKEGEILVDGKKRKDTNYGVGFLDVINIPKMNKSWRVSPQGGFKLIEVDDANLKVCKITDKKILKGGTIQLNLDDGKNINTDKKLSTQNSIIIQLPELKIIKELKLEKGALALVLGGKNAGLVSKIQEIDKEQRRVWLKKGEVNVEVPLKLIIIIGTDKPEIKIE